MIFILNTFARGRTQNVSPGDCVYSYICSIINAGHTWPRVSPMLYIRHVNLYSVIKVLILNYRYVVLAPGFLGSLTRTHTLTHVPVVSAGIGLCLEFTVTGIRSATRGKAQWALNGSKWHNNGARDLNSNSKLHRDIGKTDVVHLSAIIHLSLPRVPDLVGRLPCKLVNFYITQSEHVCDPPFS